MQWDQGMPPLLVAHCKRDMTPCTPSAWLPKAIGFRHRLPIIGAARLIGADSSHTMRILAYLGFLFVWLLAPAPMAITIADTPVQAGAPDGAQPLQLPEEDLLNLLDYSSGSSQNSPP